MRVIGVIDMQNDFLDGALANEEGMKIIPAMAEFLKKRKTDDVVVATRDTHQEDYMQTSEGKHLPVKHCIEGSFGWEIRKEITEAMGEDAIVVNKPNFGMSSETWREILKGIDVTEIVLVGVCTDICVVSNALSLKSAFPEIPVCVIPDLCAGVTVESHKAALLTMQMCQVDMIEA